VRALRPLLYLCCCTALWAEAASADVGIDARCGFTDARNVRNATALAQGIASSTPRPSLPLFADAPSGRFRIHFTRTGADAVPSLDSDADGLEDYVEEAIAALESAYDVEVSTQGFAKPLEDADSGGSNAVDVYLRDLSKENGTGLYGVTRLERLAPGTHAWDRYVSFMEIDNDFSASDRNAFDSLIYTSTNGIDALRVTCAHEFHHVLQLGAYGFSGLQLMFYELTSTWMEQLVYPEILDWHTYTAALLRIPEGYPFSRGDALNGYAWGWFGRVLHERSDTLLRRAWDRLAAGQLPFAALADACRDAGMELGEIFCAAMPMLYRTGSRATANPYLPSAERLPELRLAIDEQVEPPSAIAGGSVRPFEVQAMRFMLPGITGRPVSTVVMTTSRNEAAMIAGDPTSTDYTIMATQDEGPNDVPIAGTAWWIRPDQQAQLCISVSGTGTVSPDGPYPQPFVAARHTALRFPVPQATPGDEATIQVRSVSFGGTSSIDVTVELDGDRVVASWPGARDLGTGVYLVEVRCAGRTDLHKIAVRR
jgi:hypothetical protein